MKRVLYDVELLKKEYANKIILDIKDLKIYEGEILGVVGANGSGKSTLLRHLAFLECLKNSKLRYGDFEQPPLHVRREISILLPEPYLLRRSVKENLLFGLKAHKIEDDYDTRINEVLDLVGLTPQKFLKRNSGELSSGETQRVAFASRLILRPKTLLLDEPTNSLDLGGLPIFRDAIVYANENWGTSFVIASHDKVWLESVVKRKVGLHFGRLIDISIGNLIVGEWQEVGENKVYEFGDDGFIVLPKSTKVGRNKGVIINPRMVNLSSGEFGLNATIKEVSHVGDEMCVKFQVGRDLLECIMGVEEFKKTPLYPSMKLKIFIPNEAIKIPS